MWERARQNVRNSPCLQESELGWRSDVWYLCLLCLKAMWSQVFFSTDASVIQNAFAYLKGFAPETIVTAILFSMVGYFNGNNKTVWVTIQGLVQTLLVRLAAGILYEYSAKCKPNKDWSGSTGGNCDRNYFECGILCISESGKKTATSPSSFKPRQHSTEHGHKNRCFLR